MVYLLLQLFSLAKCCVVSNFWIIFRETTVDDWKSNHKTAKPLCHLFKIDSIKKFSTWKLERLAFHSLQFFQFLQETKNLDLVKMFSKKHLQYNNIF